MDTENGQVKRRMERSAKFLFTAVISGVKYFASVAASAGVRLRQLIET
jgi:hypothetical protein